MLFSGPQLVGTLSFSNYPFIYTQSDPRLAGGDPDVQYVAAAPAAPPPVPTHDSDGDSISSSDRESLEEKRRELIEAQEAYEEELEEAYDD